MKSINRYFAGLFMLAITVASGRAVAADVDEAAKYKLQSVYLYNFISAVEWPKLVYSSDEKNIDLCIIGADKLGKVMDEVAAKALTRGVRINIRRGITPETTEGCNIAYISSETSEVLAKLQNKPILTVSEAPGFTKDGGVIEFTLQGSNVRFGINNHVAKAHGLKINPQLLEAALEVIN